MGYMPRSPMYPPCQHPEDRRRQERAALERAMASYYGSLSVAEVEELAAWGEFAIGEFPNGAA